MALGPLARGTEAVQEVVPAAVPVTPVVTFVQVTEETTSASEAVPAKSSGVSVVRYVGFEVGAVIAMVGAVGSYVTVTVRLAAFPTSSKEVTVIWLGPSARGTEALQALVPTAVPVPPVAVFDQVTFA